MDGLIFCLDPISLIIHCIHNWASHSISSMHSSPETTREDAHEALRLTFHDVAGFPLSGKFKGNGADGSIMIFKRLTLRIMPTMVLVMLLTTSDHYSAPSMSLQVIWFSSQVQLPSPTAQVRHASSSLQVALLLQLRRTMEQFTSQKRMSMTSSHAWWMLAPALRTQSTSKLPCTMLHAQTHWS